MLFREINLLSYVKQYVHVILGDVPLFGSLRKSFQFVASDKFNFYLYGRVESISKFLFKGIHMVVVLWRLCEYYYLKAYLTNCKYKTW